MRWWIYNLFFPLVYLLLLPRYLWRMWRRGGYRRGFGERFALYGADTRRRLSERPRVWVHAVSVGEMFLALKFIEALRAARPEWGFAVTTTTSTGRAVAARELRPEDVLLYVPCDWPPVIRRALAAIRPRALLLLECELWPNLIRGAAARGVPVALLNGRISERSYRGYRRLRWFFAPVLRSLTLLLAQTEADAQRLRELGAPTERLRVMGSAKYDAAPAAPSDAEAAWARLEAYGIRRGDPLIVGGSTWPGEERALVEAWRALRADAPRLKLILVPRHAERGNEVEEVVRAAGVPYARRSAAAGGGGAGPEAQILLADTTGELRLWYACASVVFVGKSLTCHGGQNPIEPATFGKPIVTGPYMENFAEVMEDFRAAQAVVQVANAAELREALRRLLGDERRREAYGQRAGALVAARRGVMARSVSELLAALPAPGTKGHEEAR